MEDDRSTLQQLLTSKSPKAQLFGVLVAIVVFLPGVFRIAGDDRLTTWQRAEQFSLEAGKFLLTVGVAAISPNDLIDKKED